MKEFKKIAPATGKKAEAKEIVSFLFSTDRIASQPGRISFDLESCAIALGELAGRISGDDWRLVQNVRANLFGLAKCANELENNLVVSHEQARN